MKTNYWRQIRNINRNSRLYFLNTFILGISFGISNLLTNYYLLSLNYSQSFIGSLVSILNLFSLLSSYPVSHLISKISMKKAFFFGYGLYGLCTLIFILYPNAFVLYSMHALSGIASSMYMVAYRPFLFDNSTEHNRSHLFSLDSALFMVSSIIGSYAGGILPTQFASYFNIAATSQQAYQCALLVGVAITFMSIGPIFFMRTPRTMSVESPARSEPLLKSAPEFAKLITPNLIISIGAGLLMPFINIFYRINFSQSDFVIGRMMALGSLAMGVGLILAPVFSKKLGKLNLVTISQSLSIPFLLLMGFASDFNVSALGYLVRLTLMNMSLPIYEVLLLELVSKKKRTILSGLLNISQNIGWSIGPFISGFLQESMGFPILFICTSMLYALATVMNLLVIKKLQPAAKVT